MATISLASKGSAGLGIELGTDTDPCGNATTSRDSHLEDLTFASASPRKVPSKKASLLSERTLHPNTNVNNYNFTSNRNTSELNTILGDDDSRLKSGAMLVQQLEPDLDEQKATLDLEKAQSKFRVDVDLFLENDICVEGGVMRGRIDVRIREHKKKAPILISGGKIRVIGFETVSGDSERFTFYQCSAMLSDIASGLERLCSSKPDLEGFSTAHEGVHYIPFELPLNSSEGGTIPKGTTYIRAGLSVSYIAMVSFRIKDPISGKKSIAHFYRNCVIWPRLDPSIVLAPTSRPLQLSDHIQTGKTGEICLTTSLHRLHWVAGQLCHIQLKIINKSNKALETVTFDLLKTVTVFKIVQKPDGDEPHLQSSHQTKSVAQSVLSIAERGKRGHASAAGWWAGIAAGETQTLRHTVLIPPDELSIPRGKLLQVSYNLRTTVSGAKRRNKDVQVSLPIEIINFLSVDPPPSSVISAPAGVYREPSLSQEAYDSESEGEELVSDYDEDREDHRYDGEENDGTGNLHIHDDTEEVVQHAVLHAQVDAESAPRFSDLYYTSLHDDDANDRGSSRQEGDTKTPREEHNEASARNRFEARFAAAKTEYYRRKTLMSMAEQRALDENVAHEPASESKSRSRSKEAEDHGYFPPVPLVDSALPTATTNKGKPRCTCGHGDIDGLADDPLAKAELPKPPRPLMRSRASSEARRRRYEQPLSGEPRASEARYEAELASTANANATLAVPCQTPGQISSPSIPSAGTVKKRIQTLEAVGDVGL